MFPAMAYMSWAMHAGLKPIFSLTLGTGAPHSKTSDTHFTEKAYISRHLSWSPPQKCHGDWHLCLKEGELALYKMNKEFQFG